MIASPTVDAAHGAQNSDGKVAALATSPKEDATYQDAESAVQMSRPDYARLSIEDIAEAIRLHRKGWTQRKIAEVIGCSQPTICYVLQRAQTPQEDIEATLRTVAPDMLATLIKKAKESSDYRGAKEVLEMAHPKLRPAQGNGAGGGGVVINIGAPGQPLSPPAIDVQVVTLSPPVSGLLHSVSDEP